ncbi:MAG: hypothetical protein M0Q26_02445 [Chitinophagaceae bacterium]|nr:hypothetical protein [Chitinophagaceae bacterium]MDP1812728.1 hypothetical protein [Sediminibacterium sp.]MDP3129624.1 hypothetical protein [Sediminibacterium sp.]
MRFLLLPLLILFSIAAQGQYAAYRISATGDTLDKVDMKGLKQGKWMVHVNPLRGEPGYEEEGIFMNGRKEGVWRKFNLMGDLLAIENYKWGNKNGACRYFTIAGPEREENWRAFNPSKAYDTIEVRDPKDPDKYERVVIKNEGNSLRHGTWKYFYPPTGQQIKIEHYFLDNLVEPGTIDSVKEPALLPNDTTRIKIPVKSKTKEVLEFEKKTSGKKNKLRDGRTGG